VLTSGANGGPRAGGVAYGAGCALARALVAILARATLDGRGHIPAAGPLLVIANHASLVDPILLAAVFPRPLVFMAKAELFRWRPLAWALRAFGVIPVRRGHADRQALQRGLAALNSGQVLLVFPEGTRSSDGFLQRAEAGVGLLAVRSRAPVLPVALLGTELVREFRAWPGRPRLVVRCGRPELVAIPEPGKGNIYQQVADGLMIRLARLMPAGRQGRYAPQSAARETPPADRAGRVRSRT
jgi:1-acyl-sn-glycerol-3-phosphate acyltransferase